ncbi:MAG TPA: N-acetylmuramoyl-L-alanine amidase CwlD [Firmicutes bacterium]|nr:N-acetylmuramoyl-L-alanine amidase CwlD [Bacillota bacterium]
MKKYKKYLMIFLGLVCVFLFLGHKDQLKESIQSWGFPLIHTTVVLDPGHGGPDGGAIRGDLMEKDMTLAISLKVRDYLSEQGVMVVMTRETDRDLAAKGTEGLSKRKTEDLHKRLEIINGSQADLFVSIHLNALNETQYRGAQTFYNMQNKESEQFAKQMQASFQKNLANTEREARPIQNVYLIKNAKVPGALAEVGFLSNESERALLADPSYQEKIALSICEAIALYLQKP